jgi:serine/threonine-protein kinase
MIGTRFNQYRITASIGAGGMGEVFRARDTRLNRDVAIKVLPKEFAADVGRLRRFEQEAKTLATLNHPNILTIHDAGVHEGSPYLVSELLRGQTLREVLGSAATTALPVRKATDYALQIAQGLAAAHGKGVVHRDLKPENIFVTQDGRVKILDFGLAKLREDPKSVIRNPKSAEAATIRIDADAILNTTQPGMVLGTPAYMAPEQVRGEPADHRADIFAFGCVLYEMLSGTRAFRRHTPVESMNAVLHDTPPELSTTHPNTPPALARIVERCLEKQPDNRFQSAKDLAFALAEISSPRLLAPNGRGLAPAISKRTALVVGTVLVVVLGGWLFVKFGSRSDSPTAGNRPTKVSSTPLDRKSAAPPASSDTLDPRRVAVMPLANFSPDSKEEYFADGMTEELISSLSKVSGLAVIARTSVMRYKTGTAGVAEVGRDLQVGTVLEGSVRKAGDQLRITVQLIDVASQAHLWATNYDREFKDVFAIQSDVAQRVAEALQIQLLGGEQQRLAKAPTANLEAYRLYLLGRAHFLKATREDAQKAVEFFTQAIALDPNYALAYAGLADVYRINLLGLPSDVARQKQREAARRGLELDDSLAETLIQDAYVKLMQDWDWAGAERQFQRATNANPNYVFAHDEYATFLYLAVCLDEALSEQKKALALDPVSPILYLDLGIIHRAAGRYDEAIAAARKALEFNASLPAAYWLQASCEVAQGRYAEALAMYEKARSLNDQPELVCEIATTHAKAGHPSEARKALAALGEQASQGLLSKVNLAALHLALGERAQALELLEQAVASREPSCLYLKDRRDLKPLLAEPRFQALLKKVGFPE